MVITNEPLGLGKQNFVWKLSLTYLQILYGNGVSFKAI